MDIYSVFKLSDDGDGYVIFELIGVVDEEENYRVIVTSHFESLTEPERATYDLKEYIDERTIKIGNRKDYHGKFYKDDNLRVPVHYLVEHAKMNELIV